MTRTLQRLLFAIAAVLIAIDIVWGWLGHFHVDLLGYGRLALLGLALLAGGIFYQTRRPDPQIAAMILCASFLVFFSAAANLLNNYLLTVAGSRIDAQLDAIDRSLGFDWYRMMVAIADHPALTTWLFHIYNIALPEVAVVIVALAWSGKAEKAYRFCIAVAAGALCVIGLWAFHPSFGAMSLYTLPPDVAARLVLSLTCAFGKAQVALLQNGPGYITLDALHGSLIGFPSYHAVLALLVIWYARSIRFLLAPALLLNTGVILSTPVQGGHHLVDVLASFPIAALALFIATRAARSEKAPKPSVVVNEKRRFTIRPVPQGFFRISATQKPKPTAPAIKPKLSGVP
jgi:hypothetical protein